MPSPRIRTDYGGTGALTILMDTVGAGIPRGITAAGIRPGTTTVGIRLGITEAGTVGAVIGPGRGIMQGGTVPAIGEAATCTDGMARVVDSLVFTMIVTSIITIVDVRITTTELRLPVPIMIVREGIRAVTARLTTIMAETPITIARVTAVRTVTREAETVIAAVSFPEMTTGRFVLPAVGHGREAESCREAIPTVILVRAEGRIIARVVLARVRGKATAITALPKEAPIAVLRAAGITVPIRRMQAV